MKLVFNSDGTGGFIASGSHLVQSFRFDPATGRLVDVGDIIPSAGLRGRPDAGMAYDPKAGLLFGTALWQREPYGSKWDGLWVAKTGTAEVPAGGRSNVVATAAAGDAPPADTSDWPRWMGPNADGHSALKGIRKDWTGGLKKVWEVEGLSPFVSTWAQVAVAGNKLVAMGKHGCLDTVYCFDADKGGRPLWVTDLAGGIGGDGWAGGSHSMPVIDGDKVYVGTDNRYACLSLAEGKVLWQKAFRTPGHAPGHPVCIWKNLAIMPHCVDPKTNKRFALEAVNKDTGEQVWTCPDVPQDVSASYTTPLVVKLNGTEQLLYNAASFALGLEPATGKVLWQYMPDPEPIAGDGETILCAQTDGSTAVVFIKRKGGGRPTALTFENGQPKDAWICQFGPTWSQPAIDQGLMFGFTPGGWGIVPDYASTLWCTDMKTGKTLWTEKKVSAAHIVAVDGCLLVLTFNGDLQLVEPSAEGFKKITEWQGAIPPEPWWTGKDGKKPAPCWTGPTIARGKIYLRSSNRLACYDLTAK